MFRKLLKHDLKSVGRVCLPITIGAAVLAIFGFVMSCVHTILNLHTQDIYVLSMEAYEKGNEGLSSVYDILYSLAHLTNFVSVMTMLFVFIAFAVLSIAVTVLIVVNFYKTLITDQGYLTFTLPVSPTKILVSKILNGAIWGTLIAIVTLIGTVLMFAPSLIFDDQSIIGFMLDSFFESVHPINSILMVFLYVENWFVGLLASLIFYFFAVFLGGVVAPKGKFATGAAFIIAGHVLYYVFQQILSVVVMFAMLIIFALIVEIGWASSMDALDPILMSNISMLISFVVLVIIGVVLFFMTKWLMNKKLNLP
ncbi:MAG: hypothetical protein IJ437_01235 [Clostridia bacterium]|nr:hypothetical protein [Clostridia bacterium]